MTDRMICEYCQTEQDKAKKCWRCGGPYAKKPNINKLSPFYCGGFMIWPERDASIDLYKFHVWQGDRRVHVIGVTGYFLRELVPEGRDPMPLIMDMIKLALGEKEVIEIEKMNSRPPAMYEIRYIEK